MCRQIANKLECHVLLPEPAVLNMQDSAKKIKVIERVPIKIVYSEFNRDNPVIKLIRNSI